MDKGCVRWVVVWTHWRFIIRMEVEEGMSDNCVFFSSPPQLQPWINQISRFYQSIMKKEQARQRSNLNGI